MFLEGLRYMVYEPKFGNIIVPSAYLLSKRTVEELKKALIYELGYRSYTQYDSSKNAITQFLTSKTIYSISQPKIVRSFVYLIGGKLINPCYGEIINETEIIVRNQDLPNNNISADDLVTISDFYSNSTVYGTNLEIESGGASTSKLLKLKTPLNLDLSTLSSPFVKIVNTTGKIIAGDNHSILGRRIYANCNFTPIIEENAVFV